MRTRTAPVWDLSLNEMPDPVAPEVTAVLRRSAAAANRYPPPYPGELAAALAGRHAVGERQVLVGPGSVGVLAQMLPVLCGPGTDVVYATPCFEAYPMLVAAAGARPVEVRVTAAGGHDLPALLERVGPRTAVVVLCSPHNPTGAAIPRARLRAFLRAVPDGVTVVLDEAYAEFDEDVDPWDPDLLSVRADVVVLRTFSKAYGLAGMRVGYALTSSATLYDRVRGASVPFAVTRAAELSALAALDAQAAVRERAASVRAARRELDRALTAALAPIGTAPPASRGNFLWLPLGDDASAFRRHALRRGVVVRAVPGEGVRVAVGPRAAHEAVVRAAGDHARTPRHARATNPR